MVAAADALRVGIEGDLHDGAQQHLVALAVNLQLARRLADSDPAATKTLLDEMGRDVHEALDDLRRLAWRIFPKLLLDSGLVEALRAAVSDAPTPIRVEGTVGRYAPELEAAMYFCCLETLQHAGTRERAIVRLAHEEDAVVFEVNAAGAGFDELDLTGVSDRLGAVGGRLEIGPDVVRGTTRPPRGTG